jgi:hypothetical protein
MSRPVVRKIVGMSLAPLLLAVVGDLEIFRIYFELFSVIVGTPPALTLRSAADGLLWTIGRTKKITLAVETAAVLAHDDSSEISQDESLRNNQMASNVQILEAYLEFLLRPCQRALVDHWPRPTPAITAPFFAGADRHLEVIEVEGYTPGYIYPGVYVCFLVRIRLGIHSQNGREYL